MHDWRKEIERRLADRRLDPAAESAIVDEWLNHVEDRYSDLVAGGASDDEARLTILKELDGANLAPLPARRVPKSDPIPAGANSSGNILADLWKDLRYGMRTLLKSPGFTAVVVLTLALGIGANTTVFTVINTLLLNPLPVTKPAELVSVSTVDSRRSPRAGRVLGISYANFEDLRQKNQVFTELAAYTPIVALTWSNGAAGERVFAELVTANYFDTLGLRPVMGRFFVPEEDRTPGAHPVAVLGYGAWQRRFGGAPDILGRTLLLNKIAITVVGIAPPEFKGINAIFGPDMWIPAMMAPPLQPVQYRDALTERSKLDFHGAARLKPGVTMAQAAADLKTIAAALEKEYPDANEGHNVALQPIAEAALGDTRQPVIFGGVVLMAVVGLVLLIACSNVANLLLARSTGRKQEIAARLALGASRGRLVRQLLTESTLLGVFGGALGFFFARQGLRLLWSFRPAEVASNFVDPKLDGSVFLFALLVSLFTGLLFGIAPAIESSRTDIVEALKEETRTAGRSRRSITFGRVLLVGQVALSMISLVTAALFLRSIQRAYDINPGFETRRLAVIMTNPGQAGYDRPRTERFYRDVRDRIAAMPGIAHVSWSSNLPFWNRAARGILIEGRETRNKSDVVTTIVNTVGLDYFATTGIPVIEGRDFSRADRDGSLPAAIVNETMASRYWPNQDPLGKRFKFSGENSYRQIVGVVKTVNYQALNEEPQPCIYLPLDQNFSDAMVLYVRTGRDPSQLLSALQREIRTSDPQVDVSDVRTGQTLIEQVLFSARMAVKLLGVFGLLALALASIGLYGIMAYSVNLRRREIGVRMALGAAQVGVLRLVLRQGMTLVGTGMALGLVLSLLVGRALSTSLYGISATDPVSLLGSALVLIAVAFAACYLPARSASRVDPLVALRET